MKYSCPDGYFSWPIFEFSVHKILHKSWPYMGITDGLPFYYERSWSGSSHPVPFSLARDCKVNAPESTSQTHFAFIKNLAILYYNCRGNFCFKNPLRNIKYQYTLCFYLSIIRKNVIFSLAIFEILAIFTSVYAKSPHKKINTFHLFLFLISSKPDFTLLHLIWRPDYKSRIWKKHIYILSL